jgi:hypothetical protein
MNKIFHDILKDQNGSLAPLRHDFKVSTIGLLFSSCYPRLKKIVFVFTSVISAHFMHFVALVTQKIELHEKDKCPKL